MEVRARQALRQEGFPPAKHRHERSLAARYQGQSFELQIKQTRGDIVRAFHRAHSARYGYAQEMNAVQIVSARVRSIGLVEKLKTQHPKTNRSRGVAKHSFAETYFNRKKVRTAVYRRENLRSGDRFRAPGIVTEYSATTLIPPDANGFIDAFGNLVINVT
jgi:N-methylhydantoinase A